MNRTKPQRGFALLMALMLVLLAGAALAGVARRSVVIALEARGSIESLQRRWAVESCRSTLLPRAGRILADAEGGIAAPKSESAAPKGRAVRTIVTEWRVRCQLAEHDIELVFTDEQSKLNANHLLKRTNRAEAQATLARLATGVSEQRQTVLLRPLPEGGEHRRRIGSFDQIFENAPAKELLGERSRPGTAASITCWGDGKLHLRRAPASLVRLVCDKPLGAGLVSAILAARDRDPTRDLEAILGDLTTFDPQRRGNAAAMLADRSSCYGIWIVARNNQRAFYAFSAGTMSTQTGSDEPKDSLDWRFDLDW